MNRKHPRVNSTDLRLRARQLVEQVVLAERTVEPQTLEWLIARHPDLASELRDQWRNLECIDGALGSAAPSDGGPHHIKHCATRQRISIPGYEIQDRIGTGGQASVVRALQLSTGQTVAIKALYGGALSSESSRRRFDREIRILVELNHPNVVSVIDRGTTDEGTPFVVMRYVDGLNLDEWCKSRRGVANGNDPRSTLALFIDICRAVDAAHSKGIVHRDLKPGNIRVDSRGRPHILDFGLARVLKHELALEPDQRLPTQTGHFVGTMPWASPEQVGAIKAAIEPYSDVFALGIVFYEMIANRLPFAAGESLSDLIDSLRKSTPMPPSLARRNGEAREKNGPPIGPALDAVILKAIRLSPSERYQTAGELAADLECVAEGRLPTAIALSERNRRMRRVAFGAAVVALIVSIASLVYWRGSVRDQTVEIVGRVWRDADRDGFLGREESGLPGIVVFEDRNDNGMLDSVAADGADGEPCVLTDQNGDYQLKVKSPRTVIRCQLPASARATFPCQEDPSRATAYAFVDASTIRRLSWPSGRLPVADAGHDFNLDLAHQSEAELVFLSTLNHVPRDLYLLRDDDLLVSVVHTDDRRFLMRIRFDQDSARVRYLGSLPLERHIADVGDVNGDGLDDLLIRAGHGVPNQENDWYLQIAWGKVDGSFDFDTPLLEFVRQQRGANPVLIDVDDDGVLDILFSLIESGGFFTFELRFARGDGDGTFQFEHAPIILRGPTDHGLSLRLPVDIDRDGDLDLLLTADDDTQNEGLSYLAIHQQPGRFELRRFIDFEPDRNSVGQDLSTIHQTIFLDVDRDGGLDLLISIAGSADPPLRLYRDVDRAVTAAIDNQWPMEAIPPYSTSIAWPRQHAARLATSGTHRLSTAAHGPIPSLYFGIGPPAIQSDATGASTR